MKKILILSFVIFASLNHCLADNNNRTVKQETTTCTTVHGSFLGNGGSTTTCTTDRPDGSRTTKITSCTTTGFSGSVGVAKGGYNRETCKTTTIDEKQHNNSQNSGYNNSNSNNNRSKNNSNLKYTCPTY